MRRADRQWCCFWQRSGLTLPALLLCSLSLFSSLSTLGNLARGPLPVCLSEWWSVSSSVNFDCLCFSAVAAQQLQPLCTDYCSSPSRHSKANTKRSSANRNITKRTEGGASFISKLKFCRALFPARVHLSKPQHWHIAAGRFLRSNYAFSLSFFLTRAEDLYMRKPSYCVLWADN